MEFQEALVKVVVPKTPTHHKEFFHPISGKQREKVSTKQKWGISFHRSPASKTSSQPQPNQIPIEFSCPISGSLMADPVIVSSGHTFERSCVDACKSLKFTPTLQDASIPDFSAVIPNLALKSTILNWCQTHSLNPPKPLNFSSALELVNALIPKNPNTQTGKEEKMVSTSDEQLIEGVKDGSSGILDLEVTEEKVLKEEPTSDVKDSLSVNLDHTVTKENASNLKEESILDVKDGSPVKLDHVVNEKKVSTSEEMLIQGVKDYPSANLDHAVTELSRKPTHFHSNSQESIDVAPTTPNNIITPPFQLATRPSCYSSLSSSSEMETIAPNINEEEEFFLTKLDSPQVFEVEEALVALRKMTRTQESSRVVLCTPRVLSAFRSLIISRYVNIQVNSVAVLVNLSLEKANKVKIVRSGLIPALIDVLKGGSPEAQEHACGAFFSLALDDHNKTAIGVLGALQPLMHMLRSGAERTRHDSALALYHLSLVQSNRSKLVKMGSVPVLLSMAKSGHMTSRVLLILRNLASGSDGRAAVLDSGGVECLVSLLRESELGESTREGCVAVLYGLSHGGLRFKGLAMAAGAVKELLKVERTGSELARGKARRMLEMLKGRNEEEEDEDWETILEEGFSRSRLRLGNGSGANSSEF